MRKFMKSGNPNGRPMTALESLSESAEPISEDDRKRWAEEWAKNCLDRILYIAITNKEIARALCETATLIAGNNNELSGLIKRNLNKGRGRPKKNSLKRNEILLIHYAFAMLDFDKNHQAARNYLIEQERLISGIYLSDESLENNITNAIKDVREGKIPLNDFPDWVQPIIQTRMDRGVKTKKRTRTQIKTKLLPKTRI